MRTAILSIILSAAGAGAAFGQAAEGTYPGTLFCEAGVGSEPLRKPVTVEIAGGRASYSVPVEGGTETGSGTMSGGQLVLTGRGTGPRAYAARYVGQVSGRGGLLTGTHTGKSGSRACQISIGLGRP